MGLHPRDVHRLNDMLRKLRDKGNTVLVVEHDRDVIEIADHVVDVGPNAGTRGGKLSSRARLNSYDQDSTLTGQYMKRFMPMKEQFRVPTGQMRIANANHHNLNNVTVDIPEGVLTVVTGVAGSGKSSLIHHAFLSQHPEAVVIDQSAVSTSIRSNPATYTGIMDDIRSLFAKANDQSPSLFSFNSKGACPDCHGLGFIYTDLAFMEGIKSPCDTCDGRRFKDDVLQYKLHGKMITDVLDMTVAGARFSRKSGGGWRLCTMWACTI